MVQLRKIYLEPLCRVLFPELSSHGFDSHKVFTVDYAEDKDTTLDYHFDNSEVERYINWLKTITEFLML